MNHMVTPETERNAAIVSRHNKAMQRLVGMFAIIEERTKEQVSCLSDLSYSQKYLDNKDDVLKILGELQEKTQRKTKVFFENLLTHLVHEVLPHEKKKRVVFDLKLKNNRPNLDICVDKGNGQIEDIYDDNGGAITNVVSMGLRFIVLSRSKNRRFLMFDEAESWVEPKNVPAFVKVLYQMSKKMGVQVVFITHHRLDLFEGAARVIELTRDSDDHILSEIIYDPKSEEPEADTEEARETLQSYIRSVRLRGFKSHTNTLLKLSPNLTVITGGNNLGKSHLGRALKAVREAQTNEKNINHDATHCRVELSLEADVTLSWEYHRNGKNRTRYSVEKQGESEPLETSIEGGRVPVWLNDYLFMENIQGFDIHVDNQKQSVFMMGEDVKPTKRAELLSMGRENNYIQKMIKRHTDMVSEHQANARNLRKRLKLIKTDLGYIRESGPLVDRLGDLEPIIEQLSKGHERRTAISNHIDRLSHMSSEIKLNEEKIKAYSMLTDIKPMKDISKLGSKLKRLEYIKSSLDALRPLENVKPLGEIKPLVNLANIRETAIRINTTKNILEAFRELPESVPAIKDNDSALRMKTLRDTSNKLEGMKTALRVFESLPDAIPGIDELKPVSLIRERSVSIIESKKKIDANQEVMKKTQDEMKEVDQEMKELIDQLGDTCPLCQQSINHTH